MADELLTHLFCYVKLSIVRMDQMSQVRVRRVTVQIDSFNVETTTVPTFLTFVTVSNYKYL